MSLANQLKRPSRFRLNLFTAFHHVSANGVAVLAAVNSFERDNMQSGAFDRLAFAVGLVVIGNGGCDGLRGRAPSGSAYDAVHLNRALGQQRNQSRLCHLCGE